MDYMITEFIHAEHIDSIQKLYVLLFLNLHPEWTGTSRQLTDQLFFGYPPLVEKALTELQEAGLVDCVEGHYQLCDNPQARVSLQALIETFEDRLTRQELLERVCDVRTPRRIK